MNKLIIILIFSLGLFWSSSAQQSNKSRSLKPLNYQKRVTTVVSDKNRSYYSLHNQEVSLITVRGPGILRVISRGRFIPGANENVRYKIEYAVDGSEPKIIDIGSTKRSGEAKYLNESLGTPGRIRDFEIELDRGEHSIEFKLTDLEVPVACRYIFTPVKPKKMDWIAYSPLRPSEPVDLISRESTVNYYRFSNEIPLKIAVNGPTQIRVLTRIENHYQMRGRIQYRIQVMEDNELINTYQLSSLRSEIASYKEKEEDFIPGKACEFVINVPKGRHSYEILLMDKDKSTVLGRFLLPLKDVKLVN